MKTHDLLHLIKKLRSSFNSKAALFILVFATIGVVALLATKAATPFVSIQPESGTKTANIIPVADPSASGSAVQFGSGGSGGVRPCSGEFPDGSCTGVIPGTHLTVHNGELHITTPGTVEAKDIRGCVYVEVEGVTIKNSKISGCTGQHTTVIRSNGHKTLVEDVEIDGGSNPFNEDLAGVGGDNLTCRRCNIHHTDKGAHFDASNYVFEYSWIHDLYMPGTCASCHGNGLYTDFTRNGIVRGNNIDSYDHVKGPNNSGALSVYNLYGDHDNLVIENNLFNAEASFCVYVGYIHNADYALTNVKFRNNKFGRKYHQGCAYYGPVFPDHHKSMNWGSTNGNVWSNNTFTDGIVIPAP